MSRIFHRSTRPPLDELDLSRTLDLAAVAILGEREAHLSAVQRLALVNAAAWWLSEPTLITPSDQPDDHGDGTSS